MWTSKRYVLAYVPVGSDCMQHAATVMTDKPVKLLMSLQTRLLTVLLTLTLNLLSVMHLSCLHYHNMTVSSRRRLCSGVKGFLKSVKLGHVFCWDVCIFSVLVLVQEIWSDVLKKLDCCFFVHLQGFSSYWQWSDPFQFAVSFLWL